MGVITAVTLPEGTMFGPVPVHFMFVDPVYFIVQVTNDEPPIIPLIERDPLRLSDPVRLLEWICHLRVSRQPSEQNLELVRQQSTGLTYYRVVRAIPAKTELSIWFTHTDFLTMLASWIPSSNEEKIIRLNLLHRYQQKTYFNSHSFQENEVLTTVLPCSQCTSSFRFVYPFICHRLFHCKQRISANEDILKCGSIRFTQSHINANNPQNYDYKNDAIPVHPRNPIVKEIFHSVLSFSDEKLDSTLVGNKSRNWCANCRLNFQLTSDLVQHMRRCQRQNLVGDVCSKEELDSSRNDSEKEIRNNIHSTITHSSYGPKLLN